MWISQVQTRFSQADINASSSPLPTKVQKKHIRFSPVFPVAHDDSLCYLSPGLSDYFSVLELRQ